MTDETFEKLRQLSVELEEYTESFLTEKLQPKWESFCEEKGLDKSEYSVVFTPRFLRVLEE